MNNLFGKCCSSDARERRAKIFIHNYFKNIIRCCKDNNFYVATNYINTLYGAVAYMYTIKDIDDFTYNKLCKLIFLTRKKYDL